jgi:hypothetical protein
VTTHEDTTRPPGFFRQRLSRFQAVVGITAGLLSIGGMVYSTTRHYVKQSVQGDIIAVVQEASSGKPVLDATVEIYTPENRLVTTLAPKQQGRARQGVNEGPYNLRVSHPRFVSQTRQVQVQPGQTTEVHVVLMRPAPLPPPPVTEKPAVKTVTDKPAVKPVDKPAARATDWPAAKAVEKTAPRVVDKPAPKVMHKPAPKVVDKPVAKTGKKVTPEKKKVTSAPRNVGVRKPARSPLLDQVQAN